MEIQRTNNSPSFQAIKLSEAEYQKVSRIIHSYRKKANPALKEQLVDIFAPHIEKEANAHEGILKQDFIQDMYLCLFDNIDKLGRRKPAEELVNKFNEVTTKDCFATMGHKSFEELTEMEMAKLGQSEDEFIHKLNINDLMLNSKKIIKKSYELTGRMQDIMIGKLEGKTNKEVGETLHLQKERVRQIILKCIEALQRDANFRALIGTNKKVFPQENMFPKNIETISEYYKMVVAKEEERLLKEAVEEQPLQKIAKARSKKARKGTPKITITEDIPFETKLDRLKVAYMRNPSYSNYTRLEEEKIREMRLRMDV